MQLNKGKERKQDVEGLASSHLTSRNRTKSRRKFFNPPVVFKGRIHNVKTTGGLNSVPFRLRHDKTGSVNLFI